MLVDSKPFTQYDRDLLKRCLHKEPGAWNDFVDRYLSLIYHVINYTAYLRSVRLGPEDVEDIAADILLQLVEENFKILRQFRGESSLATYLTVVARRLCVRELVRRKKRQEALARGDVVVPPSEVEGDPAAQKGLERLEEVEYLLKHLKGREREIVRLYYLEGRTYEEISIETNVPVNTIGVVLSRAREKLRRLAKRSPSPAAGAAQKEPTASPAPVRTVNPPGQKTLPDPLAAASSSSTPASSAPAQESATPSATPASEPPPTPPASSQAEPPAATSN
ncbi:sigma-70 family RNA polymerase sigma factor [thermophilic bacterium 2918]|uniref:Sigma-70 family RNA polymerase sigma factor n=1 Tax=Thermogemmata fonticola TaxID=2755323 RepID=A0A7V8VCH7_9BACT|nr:sigma-70 family RNA polymerase sigma factor [Thermogemmata fonticola]